MPPAACPRQPAGGTISGGHISNLTWRKASYSSSNGGNCVEVAQVPSPGVAVRDSKDPGGPVLVVTPQQWRAFATGIKADEFDLA